MLTHQPVLPEAAITALNIRPNYAYVDATFGRGGHAMQIANRLDDSNRLLLLDKDPEAIACAQQLCARRPYIHSVQSSFADLSACLAQVAYTQPVGGILMDLGVSSPQIDDPTRGFSFTADGPLDMRMDPTQELSAAMWLKDVSANTLIHVLLRYGEEPLAKRIARAILKARASHEICTTHQLATIVASAYPARLRWQHPNRHPATKTFQAIRIAVNHELEALELGLEQAYAQLATSGRLVIISFHSLEDRIVKRFFRSKAQGDPRLAKLPIPDTARSAHARLIGRALRPSEDEISANRRARSAVMRVLERC